MSHLKVWVDGACVPNPGKGGWGFTDLVQNERSGSERNATNQTMELSAALEALKFFKYQSIIIYSDSQYLVKGMNEWIVKWKRQGWSRREKGKKAPIKNLELWKALDDLRSEYHSKGYRVEFHWVQGHAGIPGNERADYLANSAIFTGGTQCSLESRNY